MKSRPFSFLRPLTAVHQPIGWGASYARPTRIKRSDPRRRLTRWATIVRRAPESAREAMDGMGAMTALPDLGADPAPAGNIWGTLSNAVTSDAFKGLVGAGATFYASQRDADAAKDAAKRGKKLSALEMQSMQTQFEANLAAQRSAQPGTPSWMLPAGIAGIAGVGLILFFVLKKKKRK